MKDSISHRMMHQRKQPHLHHLNDAKAEQRGEASEESYLDEPSLKTTYRSLDSMMSSDEKQLARNRWKSVVTKITATETNHNSSILDSLLQKLTFNRESQGLV